jgi:hypothetical protein
MLLIWDLLRQPANVKSDNKEIYRVLAPEILRGEEYTQASDIYGLHMKFVQDCLLIMMWLMMSS